MADNKKYYYLKLKENFFDSDEMKLLEGMPDGYKYSNILLKLYLRSLKDNGRLMLNSHIPYSEQMIASVTGHSVGDVTAALSVFRDLGLIEKLDNGAIYMLDIQNFIGKSSTEAERKKEYRNKIKAEKELEIAEPKAFIENSGQMSGQKSDDSTPELEIEIEKDIEIEKETNQQPESKDKNEDQKPSVGQSVKKYCDKIVDFFQFKCNFGGFSPVLYQDLDQDFSDWLKLNGDPEEVTNIFCLALKETASVRDVRKPYQYAQGILDNWERDKHTTLAAVKADLSKQDKPSAGNSYNYRKRIVVQKEELPEWAKKDYQVPEESAEEQEHKAQLQAEIKRRLAEIKADKDGEQNVANS